ncbi:MAG: polyprenyl diphosphate synthase [Candidatus Puniceispirillaceae bacterium]
MLPHHLAIIMDGNRRWAKQRRFDILRGHNQGTENLRQITKYAHERDIRYLTVFAFSTENWRRPKQEVKGLIELMRRFLMQDIDRLVSDNVRLRIMGNLGAFDDELQKLFQEAVDVTASNTGINLTIAVNYGGKQDILQAARKLAKQEELGFFKEDDLKSSLQTALLPEVDFLIRTGGERRLSNFLLWDSAYAELYFSDKYWPDFSEADLDKALADFQARQRRYGGDIVPEPESQKA